MLPRNHPDRIQIAFDDHGLVAKPGLILPSTLALRLGSAPTPPEAPRPRQARQGRCEHRRQDDDPGGLRPSRRSYCIDDADVLRAGGTARVLGFTG